MSLRHLAALVLAGTLGLACAQEAWTVQTAAFQDNRQAGAVVEELIGLGFDAYSEFAMYQGRQYSRVRVGCFLSRAAADAFARNLRGRVTRDAVPQPLTAGAPTRACIRREVGFVKPESWRIERRGAGDILFRVEVAGHAAFIHHSGSAWRLAPSAELLQPGEPPLRADRFRQGYAAGAPVVQAKLGAGSVNACYGRLLWQHGDVAVVEQSTSVIACVVEEAAAGSARAEAADPAWGGR